jgi:hypothetical protein
LKISGGGIATGNITGTEQNDESESGELTANLKANAFIASSDKRTFICGVRDLVLASSASKWLQAGRLEALPFPWLFPKPAFR